MKKNILFLITLMISISASAQVTIQMEKDGGVYKIPCTVNGVKMKFIFDTGASAVSMSQTMAQFLLDGEYLSSDDIIGKGQSVVADGSIVNHSVIKLRDIEIGGLHLYDIQATVLSSQNAPLLFGQSAISELGKITIEGDKLIIHRADNAMSQEQCLQLLKQGDMYRQSASYLAAIECYEKVDAAYGLSAQTLCDLCYCYYMNRQYVKCNQACIRWINDNEDKWIDDYQDIPGYEKDFLKEYIYHYLAGSYYFIGSPDKALLWYQKELVLLNDAKDIAINKRYQAWCYEELGRYKDAQRFNNDYVTWRLGEEYKKRGCTSKEFAQLAVSGKIHDEDLGYICYESAMIYYKLEDFKNGDYLMITGAKMGCIEARNYCDRNIRPYVPEYQTKDWNW